MTEVVRMTDMNQVSERIRDLIKMSPLIPFSETSVELLQKLSTSLLTSARRSPNGSDLAALGNWIRRSQLERFQRVFLGVSEIESSIRVARGLVFQVSPANVELQFAYIWALSVLCGCPIITRLSSRRTQLTDEFLELITEVTGKMGCASPWLFVEHDRSEEGLTGTYCGVADVLIFWGGDLSVNSLKQFPTKADSKTIAFPNRESIALIDSRQFLLESDQTKKLITSRLLSDLTAFGQGACSSPRYLVWVGSKADRDLSLETFLFQVEELGAETGTFSAHEKMSRLSYLFEYAARSHGTLGHRVIGQLMFLFSDEVRDSRTIAHPGCGAVVVLGVNDLNQLKDLVLPQDQTFSQFGFDREPLEGLVRTLGTLAPRRIVPIGGALNFDYRWDGLNLISELTRVVSF